MAGPLCAPPSAASTVAEKQAASATMPAIAPSHLLLWFFIAFLLLSSFEAFRLRSSSRSQNVSIHKHMHPQRSVFFYTIGNEIFYRIKKDCNQHSSWNTLAVRIHSSPTFSDSAPHSSDSPPDILRREHIPSSRGPEAPFGSKTPLRRPFLFHTNGHPEPLPYGTDKCRASIICIIQWYSITVLCACQV